MRLCAPCSTLRRTVAEGQHSFDSLAAIVRATLERTIMALYPAEPAAAAECVAFLEHCNELLWATHEKLHVLTEQPRNDRPVPATIPTPPPQPLPPDFGLRDFWPPTEAAQRFLQSKPARFELPGPPADQLGNPASQVHLDVPPKAAMAPPSQTKKARGRPTAKRAADIAAEAVAAKTTKRTKSDEVQLPIRQQVKCFSNQDVDSSK